MNQKEIAIRQELLDKIEGITGCLDSLVNLSTRDMAIIYFELVGQKVDFADKHFNKLLSATLEIITDLRFYERVLAALRKID